MCGVAPPERMDAMPKKYPSEFKGDVARVARRGDTFDTGFATAVVEHDLASAERENHRDRS
jgi:hypothetical protein